MKKKHSYYWCQDTKDEEMCMPEEEMGMEMDMCEEHMKMHKPMMHMHEEDMKMHKPMMHMHEEDMEMHDHMMHMHTDEMEMTKPMHMHKNMRLAHAYVPWQFYHKAFSPREALCKGTLFPELFGVYKVPM